MSPAYISYHTLHCLAWAPKSKYVYIVFITMFALTVHHYSDSTSRQFQANCFYSLLFFQREGGGGVWGVGYSCMYYVEMNENE